MSKKLRWVNCGVCNKRIFVSGIYCINEPDESGVRKNTKCQKIAKHRSSVRCRMQKKLGIVKPKKKIVKSKTMLPLAKLCGNENLIKFTQERKMVRCLGLKHKEDFYFMGSNRNRLCPDCSLPNNSHESIGMAIRSIKRISGGNHAIY